jgi:hypothetical protein
VPSAPFDPTEDAVHSVAATAMGFAFAFGVVAVFLQRTRPRRRRVSDTVAVGASIVIPLAMVAWPDVGGVLQRMMFVIAYLWYGVEASGRTAPA